MSKAYGIAGSKPVYSDKSHGFRASQVHPHSQSPRGKTGTVAKFWWQQRYQDNFYGSDYAQNLVPIPSLSPKHCHSTCLSARALRMGVYSTRVPQRSWSVGISPHQVRPLNCHFQQVGRQKGENRVTNGDTGVGDWQTNLWFYEQHKRKPAAVRKRE